MRKRIRTLLQSAPRTMLRHFSSRSDRVIAKLLPALFSLHRAPAPAGAFRSATERSEALSAEMPFLFSHEKKEMGGAKTSRSRSERKYPACEAGENEFLPLEKR